MKKVTIFSFVFFYVVVLTGLSYLANGKSYIGVDDANIYMVYMKHFAEGHGFVYNIGGERVEGFTSLLWTLIGSLVFALTLHPEIFLLGINIYIIAFALYRIVMFIEQHQVGNTFLSNPSLLFLGLTGLFPGFIDWTVLSLMETGLWSTLLMLISLEIITYKPPQKKWQFYIKVSFLLILLVASRPESMLWSPLFIAFIFIKEYVSSTGLKKSLYYTAIPALAFIISLGTIILWRLKYFGYPFPNTYYAKVSMSMYDNLLSGGKYIRTYLFSYPLTIIVLVFIYIYIRREPKQHNLTTWIKHSYNVLFLSAVIGISLLIPLYTGGDHFRYYRFFQPTTPLLVLMPFVTGVYNFKNWKMGFTLGVVLLVTLSSRNNFRDIGIQKHSTIRHEFLISEQGRQQSEELNLFFREAGQLPTQGVFSAGGSAFTYLGETIDLLGLNDTKMSHIEKVKDPTLPKNHASFNKDVFYDYMPDIFWFKGMFIEGKDTEYAIIEGYQTRMFKHIHLDEKFKELYCYCNIRKANYERHLQIFANRDFLHSLDTSLYLIKEIRYE